MPDIEFDVIASGSRVYVSLDSIQHSMAALDAEVAKSPERTPGHADAVAIVRNYFRNITNAIREKVA